MQYIIPNTGDFAALTETLQRAKIPFYTPQSLREFIIQTHDTHTAFSAMSAQDMMVLERHSPTLISELPSIVMAVPGVYYQPDWMGAVSIFPPLDWKTVEKSIAKSGETAYTMEDVVKRDRGAPVSLSPMEEEISFSDTGPVAEEDIE